MHQKRMENLLRVARAIPPKELDMRAITSRHNCRTLHCLAGWAGVDPWMRRQGLRIDRDGDLLLHRRDGTVAGDLLSILQEFFDLPYSTVVWLFGFSSANIHATKRTVVKNVRLVLAGKA